MLLIWLASGTLALSGTTTCENVKILFESGGCCDHSGDLSHTGAVCDDMASRVQCRINALKTTMDTTLDSVRSYTAPVDVGQGVQLILLKHSTVSLGATCPLETLILIPANATRSFLLYHGAHSTPNMFGNSDPDDEYNLARWVGIAARGAAIISFISTPGLGRVVGTCPRNDVLTSFQPVNDVVSFVHETLFELNLATVMHSSLIPHSTASLFVTSIPDPSQLDVRITSIEFTAPLIHYTDATNVTREYYESISFIKPMFFAHEIAPTPGELFGICAFLDLTGAHKSFVDVVMEQIFKVTQPENFVDRYSMYEMADIVARRDYKVLNVSSQLRRNLDYLSMYRNNTMDVENLCMLIDGRRVRVVTGLYDETVNWREQNLFYGLITNVCGRSEVPWVVFDSVLGGTTNQAAHRLAPQHIIVEDQSTLEEMTYTELEAKSAEEFDAMGEQTLAALVTMLNQTRNLCPGRVWSVPCALALTGNA